MSASAEARLPPVDPPPLRATIRTKGVVTIPQEVRRAVRLEEGDEVMVTIRDGEVVLTPATVIPRDQAWFWTPEWQAREAEAEADIAASRVTRHSTDSDFLDSLESD
ncbi:MAG: AbrB/MazE/SpoVT family DNA-binding domain-containing protein [Demequinaceae bacterium]|nr:AbrB/MazE/SpoVT family DNA-binding domain-containing protein [Demequinaceae bacterium]